MTVNNMILRVYDHNKKKKISTSTSTAENAKDRSKREDDKKRGQNPIEHQVQP